MTRSRHRLARVGGPLALTALLVAFAVGTIGVFWELGARSETLYRGMALQGTELQVRTIHGLRELYTSEVIAHVPFEMVAKNANEAATDGKVPLPATLTKMIGKRLSEHRAGADVRLYSDHPFPGASDRGPLDDFDREALRRLREQPDEPYFRFEQLDGRPVLRYAVADRMQAGCVTCHNSHPDSPKTDWKLGDVRGVLEVVRPLDDLGPIAVAQARTDARETLNAAAIMAIAAFVGLAIFSITTLRRSRVLAERAGIAAFTADVGAALAGSGALQDALQRCAECAVRRFDAAFTRIWTLNDDTQTLELQASAGLYTHIDGGHARVPVGKFKIGWIAQERRPHLTNHVLGDSRVGDQDWAKREGMVAFAGYPLMVENRVIGVMGLFARHPFSKLVTDALASVADMLSVGISRQRAAESLQTHSKMLEQANCELEGQKEELEAQRQELVAINASLEVSREAAETANAYTRAIIDNAAEGIVSINARGIVQTFNPAAERNFGYTAAETVGKNVKMLMPPAESANHDRYLQQYQATGQRRIIGTSREVVGRRKDGSTFPIDLCVSEMRVGHETVFIALLRDISEHKAKDRKLQETLRRTEELAIAAQGADRAKSDFLANMSHEIRTPMTAILGFADLLHGLAEDHPLPPGGSDAVQTIRRNGQHLLGVINDVLDLSKIEAGHLATERVLCSLPATLADIQSLMRVQAMQKKLSLGIETPQAIPMTIRTDPARLRQILMNLIGNAIKFTEAGGVRLVVRTIAGEGAKPLLQFDVVDSGIGINPDAVEGLFQPFVQADSTTTRRFGGTGLGLSISRRLAQLLGGDVTIVDTKPGLGTRFRVTIDPGSLDGVERNLYVSDALGVPPTGGTAPPPRAPATLKGRRVLLAEDGPDNQRLIRVILSAAGLNVTVADNGRIAMDKALEAQRSGTPFDLILMDMQMPEMDGYDATRALRRAGYPGAIVALTAHAMTGDREKTIDAGCDDYDTKPIDRARLLQTIAKNIETKSHPPVLAVSSPIP